MINLSFYICLSLSVMVVGLLRGSVEMIVCGFLATQLWLATKEIIKAMKND
jgi:hypothetical protein